MVHGILQFTPSIAFRYVLHRCESRDIRCRESFVISKKQLPHAHTTNGATRGVLLSSIILGTDRAGVRFLTMSMRNAPRGEHAPMHTDWVGATYRKLMPLSATPRVFFTCSQVILLCRFRQ
jgi:hypothetical protein